MSNVCRCSVVRVAVPVAAPVAIRLAAGVAAMVMGGVPLMAAPLSINGASFDAPAACRLAEGAMVCKDGTQQLELWVYRKPLAVPVMVADRESKRARAFSDFHDVAVGNILRSTGNDPGTPFAEYGRYAVVGTAMAGKGDVKRPSVRVASLLSGDEMWQFVEIVATRTPGIDALANALQRSLVLPVAVDAATAAGGARDTTVSQSTSGAATFAGTLATFQYPDFLTMILVEDSAAALNIGFRHKAREGGPNVTLSIRTPTDKAANAAAVNAERRQRSIAVMAPGSAAVDVKKLGAFNGTGYALLGTPDAKQGLSGVESIETAFAADVDGRLLEVRLTGEQKHAAEVERVWMLLNQSIKLLKP